MRPRGVCQSAREKGGRPPIVETRRDDSRGGGPTASVDATHHWAPEVRRRRLDPQERGQDVCQSFERRRDDSQGARPNASVDAIPSWAQEAQRRRLNSKERGQNVRQSSGGRSDDSFRLRQTRSRERDRGAGGGSSTQDPRRSQGDHDSSARGRSPDSPKRQDDNLIETTRVAQIFAHLSVETVLCLYLDVSHLCLQSKQGGPLCIMQELTECAV